MHTSGYGTTQTEYWEKAPKFQIETLTANQLSTVSRAIVLSQQAVRADHNEEWTLIRHLLNLGQKARRAGLWFRVQASDGQLAKLVREQSPDHANVQIIKDVQHEHYGRVVVQAIPREQRPKAMQRQKQEAVATKSTGDDETTETHSCKYCREAVSSKKMIICACGHVFHEDPYVVYDTTEPRYPSCYELHLEEDCRHPMAKELHRTEQKRRQRLDNMSDDEDKSRSPIARRRTSDQRRTPRSDNSNPNKEDDETDKDTEYTAIWSLPWDQIHARAIQKDGTYACPAHKCKYTSNKQSSWWSHVQTKLDEYHPQPHHKKRWEKQEWWKFEEKDASSSGMRPSPANLPEPKMTEAQRRQGLEAMLREDLILQCGKCKKFTSAHMSEIEEHESLCTGKIGDKLRLIERTNIMVRTDRGGKRSGELIEMPEGKKSRSVLQIDKDEEDSTTCPTCSRWKKESESMCTHSQSRRLQAGKKQTTTPDSS